MQRRDSRLLLSATDLVHFHAEPHAMHVVPGTQQRVDADSLFQVSGTRALLRRHDRESARRLVDQREEAHQVDLAAFDL